MGRIREALRRTDDVEKGLSGTHKPRPFPPEEQAQSKPRTEEEVPFIEVGGPDGVLEASASVLAAASTKGEGSHASQIGGKKGPSAVSSGSTSNLEITGIKFQPHPPEVRPLPPARERFAGELVCLHDPQHPLSERYQKLAADLQGQLPGGQPQVLLFTAATAETHTTTVVLNLAIAWARQARSPIAVVDANIGRPGVAQSLGILSAPGLREVLAGNVSLQRAVQETGENNLHALTAGMPSGFETRPGMRQSLVGEAMRSVLRHLRARYPLVLIDAPRWDGRPEVVSLGSACDAVYLVLGEQEAGDPANQELVHLIPEQGSNLRGCIYLCN